MAFLAVSPADAENLVGGICDFAQFNLGWGRSGNDITPPGGTSGFRLSVESRNNGSSTLGYVRFDIIRAELINYALPTGMSYDDVPTPRGTCNWLSPVSNAWLFGGEDPDPWLHVVVETAPGYFHHLYFGRLEPYGNWSGRAIFSGTNWVSATNYAASRRQWDYGMEPSLSGPMLLFQAVRNGSRAYGAAAGFVEVDHPEAPMPVFRFINDVRSTQPCVTGGFGTAYNGLLTGVAPNSFDNSVATQPIILFHIDAQHWSRPLGRVSGVRMINTTQFTPGEVVDFAGDTYQVFPLGTRRVGYGGYSMTGGYPGTAPGGPGIHTPSSLNGLYYHDAGMGTEFWGVAVRRES